MSKKPALSPKLAALQAQLQQGMQWHQGGFLAEAEAIYRQVLASHAKHVDALHLLGVLCAQTGRAAEGVGLIQQAVKLNGLAPALHSNLANALLACGRAQEAVASASKALALQPTFVDALCSKGNALRELRRLVEAVASYDQAIALNPQIPEVWSNRGNALSDLHRHAEAVASFDRALALRPQFPDAWCNRGAALSEQGLLDEALQSYGQALALKPAYPEALNNRANTLREMGRLQDAVEAFEQALSARPDYPDALSNLGVTLQEIGRQDEAIARYRQALSLQGDHLKARSNLLFSLSFDPNCTPQAYLAEARVYGEQALARAQPFTTWRCTPGAGKSRPLRVGLVSGDLRHHPVGFFLEGLLNHLDANRTEVVAFSTRAQEDDLTQRLRARCVGWHAIGGLDEARAAQLIHDQAIDVLVDLAGHTSGNMLGAFAFKPAPVQVSWLGFLASTGVPGMDHVLADPITVPPGSEDQFTEHVWRLPTTVNCFTPLPDDPALAVSALPALSRGHVTLGCVQNLAKVGDGVLRTWARVLQALPTARLRLQNKQLDHARGREALQARLQAAGVDLARVDLIGSIAGRVAHLASHDQVDLMLDPFPYPGITTTCEALWMGVPTVTLAGRTMLSRQGASLMSAAGLPDWVAHDVDDYVALVARQCTDLPALSQLRQRLRAQVQASVLFDPATFAGQWQEALGAMTR